MQARPAALLPRTSRRAEAPVKNGRRVALVGDVALELLAPYFREAGFETYVPPGFGAWRQEMLDKESGLRRFAPDFVFDVTSRDAALSREVPGFFDERMRKLASMPYSLDGIDAIVDEARFAALAAPKKAIAVDADNTLWCGILSEDGRDALVPCVEFQKGLLRLREKGVVLLLLTKNDPASPFMRGDMPLSDGDFAALRINWAPKAGNLVEACRELNIGTESVVFVDDNPHERAQMEAHLPEVTVAPWRGWGDPSRGDAEACQLLRRLEECFFSGMGETEEDRLRVPRRRGIPFEPRTLGCAFHGGRGGHTAPRADGREDEPVQRDDDPADGRGLRRAARGPVEARLRLPRRRQVRRAGDCMLCRLRHEGRTRHGFRHELPRDGQDA